MPDLPDSVSSEDGGSIAPRLEGELVRTAFLRQLALLPPAPQAEGQPEVGLEAPPPPPPPKSGTSSSDSSDDSSSDDDSKDSGDVSFVLFADLTPKDL